MGCIFNIWPNLDFHTSLNLIFWAHLRQGFNEHMVSTT